MEKELKDLSVVYQSIDQVVKHLCSRQDKLKNLMIEMNNKYKNIVSMMAKFNGRTLQSESGNYSNQGIDKGIQIEGHRTPVLTGEGVLNTGIGKSSTQGNVKMEYKMNIKIPKIDYPYFRGEGPRKWLRKAKKYFQIHQVPKEMKIGIAKMYLKIKVDIWFLGFINSYPEADWEFFSTEICRRFIKLQLKT